MGSHPFLTVARGKSAEEAFWRAVAEAIQAHGDDGETGTIAEKWSFVEFRAPRAVRSFDLARWALYFDNPASEGRLADMPLELEPLVARIADVARGKAGPAAAIGLAPEESIDHAPLAGDALYLFIGWAAY